MGIFIKQQLVGVQYWQAAQYILQHGIDCYDSKGERLVSFQKIVNSFIFKHSFLKILL